MSHNGHTPGPWRISAESPYSGRCCVLSGNETVAIVSTSANARLIAAAPELYEALKEFVNSESLSIGGGTERDHMIIRSQVRSKAISMARAALAKAEGKEVEG